MVFPDGMTGTGKDVPAGGLNGTDVDDDVNWFMFMSERGIDGPSLTPALAKCAASASVCLRVWLWSDAVSDPAWWLPFSVFTINCVIRFSNM